MDVLNEYPNSHHYIEKYERAERFCPGCGERTVWEKQGPGDYYCGPENVCTSCGIEFTIQGEGDCKESIVRQLRSGITEKPTTPMGH